VEGFSPTRFGRLLYARSLFDNFARGSRRRATYALRRARHHDPAPLASGFGVSDEMLDEFKEFVRSLRVQIDEEAWEQDREFIRAMIRKEIDTDLFGVAAPTGTWPRAIRSSATRSACSRRPSS
jgi:hypothetical protein